MKIEELRINNWVNLFLGIDDNGTQYRPMQIKGIMEDLSGEFYYLNTNSANWVYSTQNLEPIPLTEDILLKIKGMTVFEFNGNKTYSLNEELIDMGGIGFDDADLYIYEQNGKYTICDIELMYLHDLQNYAYYKLGNKELEINL